MIRLSEAMARMHCCDKVHPKHVKEAFRLLNKSIIRVETPEINFEAEEQQPMVGEEEEDEEGEVNGIGNGVANGHMNGDSDHVSNGVDQVTTKPAAPATTRKIKVTYEQYRSIANLIIMHLRHLEETEEDGECVLECEYKSSSLNIPHFIHACGLWRYRYTRIHFTFTLVQYM